MDGNYIDEMGEQYYDPVADRFIKVEDTVGGSSLPLEKTLMLGKIESRRRRGRQRMR